MIAGGFRRPARATRWPMSKSQPSVPLEARVKLRGAVVLAAAAMGLFLGLTIMLEVGRALGASETMLWRLSVGHMAAAFAVLISVIDARRKQAHLERVSGAHRTP